MDNNKTQKHRNTNILCNCNEIAGKELKQPPVQTMSINEDSAVNKKHGRDEDNETTPDTTTTNNTAISINAAGCNNNNNNNTLPQPAQPLLTHSLSSSYEYLSYQIEQMQQNALQRRLDMSTAIIGDINIDPNTIKVLWKDLVFLLLGCIALSIIGYVETHSSAIPSSVEPTTRTTSATISNPNVLHIHTYIHHTYIHT